MKSQKQKSLTTKKKQEERTYRLFILPALFIFCIVVVVPFFQGMYFSMTDWNGLMLGGQHFVGLKNFKDALADVRFNYSFRITILYSVVNFLVINIVSFLLALMVSSKLKGKNVYRAGFFLPNLIGGLVLGYIWKFIFNFVFTKFALPYFQTHLFLAEPKLAIIALLITSTWQSAGYYMLIYYTALQNVPKELEESAELDGAGRWQVIRNVVLPMIAPSITVIFFLTMNSSFKTYDVLVSLTNAGPSTMWHGQAVNSTELIAFNIMQTGSVENNMSLAQAKAVIFFILLTILSVIQIKYNQSKETEL